MGPRRSFYLYDWANSAFATTTLAVVYQTYFVSIVPEGGAVVGGARLAGDALWTLAYGLSVAVAVCAMPVIGAAADAAGRKRVGLAIFCALGGVASAAMALVLPGRHWLGALLLMAGNVGFAGGNALYNAFLPAVSPPGRMDEVSARGFAAGYLGGGALLALHLGLILGHDSLGLSQVDATRLACGSVGVWWLGFGLLAVRGLPAETSAPGWSRAAALGDAVSRLRATLRELRARPTQLLLVAAIMLYQNGVQTVIVVAALVGQEVLDMPRSALIGSVLLIQAVGVAGSWLMGSAARRLGTKPVIMSAVAIWTALTTYAALGMRTQLEFWVLAAVVGLVLGGTQALSRSLFATVVPRGRDGEFFGFYALCDKLSAVAGPLAYAAARQLTGSIRLAALSLVVFFVAGLLLLWRTPVLPVAADAAPRAGT